MNRGPKIRTERMWFRISPSMKEAIFEKAKRLGLTASRYVERVLANDLKKDD